MKLELDDWQKTVLETKGNICLRSGRQVGKSTVISIKAAKYALENKKKTVLVIASVERQAFLLFEKILAYLMDNYKSSIKMGKDRPTKSRLRLKNGSTIYSLPTGLTGHGIRGYTVDLLIADEAAFIYESVWNAVTPMLAVTRGTIILLSTPFGRKGYFSRCFDDESFSNFHVSALDSPRADPVFLAQEKARMTKLQWQQEYLGEFVDELMQFFTDDLIIKCMRGERPGVIAKGNNYYLGVDVARMGKDESTFEIVNLLPDRKLVHVENQITTKTLLSDTTKHILGLNNLYDFQKIFIDDEGIGVGVYDNLLVEDTTKRKIIPINNSKRITDHLDKAKVRLLKEDLYANLLRLMERGEITLLDDPEVFQSLKSVQYDYTSDNMGRPHLKIFGNYTHIAEGLIRAAWCVKYKPLSIWISSIKV